MVQTLILYIPLKLYTVTDCQFGHVCSHAVSVFYSDLQGTGGRRLCVTVEPALLLKGDIMVSSHLVKKQKTTNRLDCNHHLKTFFYSSTEINKRKTLVQLLSPL